MLILNKPIGMTPLDCIQLWKDAHPVYADVRIGYAGRLDPMAEGVLIALVGEENKQRESYLSLDKEYLVTVACGVATDTQDVMGLVTASTLPVALPDVSSIRHTLQTYVGDIMQTYPPYSSKTVQGKPLYAWAREGKIHEIVMPTAQRHIDAIELLDVTTIPLQECIQAIHAKLDLVAHGDFRIGAIHSAWDACARQHSQDASIPMFTLRVVCSSGTYMRILANDIGTALGFPALAYAIKRTRVGPHTLPPAGQ